MLQLAEDEAIAVEFSNFSPPVRGIYFTEECLPPIIGLNNSLPGDTPLLRCILAEEFTLQRLGIISLVNFIIIVTTYILKNRV
jgi:hypothetical protein